MGTNNRCRSWFQHPRAGRANGKGPWWRENIGALSHGSAGGEPGRGGRRVSDRSVRLAYPPAREASSYPHASADAFAQRYPHRLRRRRRSLGARRKQRAFTSGGETSIDSIRSLDQRRKNRLGRKSRCRAQRALPSNSWLRPPTRTSLNGGPTPPRRVIPEDRNAVTAAGACGRSRARAERRPLFRCTRSRPRRSAGRRS